MYFYSACPFDNHQYHNRQIRIRFFFYSLCKTRKDVVTDPGESFECNFKQCRDLVGCSHDVLAGTSIVRFPWFFPLIRRGLRSLPLEYNTRDFFDTWYWLSATDEPDYLAEGCRIWCGKFFVFHGGVSVYAIARSCIKSRKTVAHDGRIRR